MLQVALKDYLEEICAALAGTENAIDEASQLLREKTIHGNHRIWVLGNGGSLAIAQHFAQDLLKLGDVRAHAINCPSIITAYSNDDNFDYAFFKPIDRLADKGDPIVIFSCSGKSRNYVEFVSGFVNVKRNPIISVVGTDGGFLKQKSDVAIHVQSNDYQVCESAFNIVADILLKRIME